MHVMKVYFFFKNQLNLLTQDNIIRNDHLILLIPKKNSKLHLHEGSPFHPSKTQFK